MKNILKFISKNLFILQSLIYWIVAITNIGTTRFWYFAVVAVSLQGMQEIINLLHELKSNQNNITNE